MRERQEEHDGAFVGPVQRAQVWLVARAPRKSACARGWETGRGAGGKILLPGLSKLRSVHVEIFLLPLNRPGNALAFPLPFGNVGALPLEELLSAGRRRPDHGIVYISRRDFTHKQEQRDRPGMEKVCIRTMFYHRSAAYWDTWFGHDMSLVKRHNLDESMCMQVLKAPKDLMCTDIPTCGIATWSSMTVQPVTGVEATSLQHWGSRLQPATYGPVTAVEIQAAG